MKKESLHVACWGCLLSLIFCASALAQTSGTPAKTESVGTGAPNHGIRPVLSQRMVGTPESYVTNAEPHSPYVYESLWQGTPQNLPAYGAYVHRIDLITRPNSDVQSSVALGTFATVHSTNSTGARTYDSTAQVAIVANASAVDPGASAPVEAINAIAGTVYSGSVPQHVIGFESDVIPNRDGTAEGGTTGAFSIGGLFSNNANTASMADGTFGVLARGITLKNSWKTAGYFSGRLVGVAAGANAGVTPDVGFWIRNAKTWGIYVGSRPIESPRFFNADMTLGNPEVGIELGETSSRSAASNTLRFSSRSSSGAQQAWDEFTDAQGVLHMQFNGADKVLITPSGVIKSGSGTSARYNGASAHFSFAAARYTAAAAPIASSLTTRAATSDRLNLPGMTSSGHCSVTATNAIGAEHFSSTFISQKADGSITIRHAPIAGMRYDVLCTLD